MLLKLAWRNLWRNKLRTSIILLAMVVGLMGVISMMGFMTGMMDSMLHNAITWQTSHLQIHNKAWLENPEINDTLVGPEKLIATLDRMPEVSAYSPRFVTNGMVASARSSSGIRINGIAPELEKTITPLASNVVEEHWFSDQGRNPVLVSTKTASKLRLKLGSKVVITFTNGAGEVTGAAFRVKGLFATPSNAFDKANVYVRQSDLKLLAGMTGIHEIAILLHDINNISKVQQQLQAISAPQNQVRDWMQLLPMMAAILASTGTSNAIMLGIFVMAMGFGIVNIMLMSVFERTREFGVLMAVGMQKHKLFSLILLETSLLGLSGACLGLACSWLLIQGLQVTGINLSAMAEGLSAYGVDSLLIPRVAASDYLLTFATVVVVTVVAAFYPAWQILKRRPVDAMAEKH